ncbi:MAG: hypothetical protein Q9181_006540 [Wetmoreana brouardii]
MRILNQLPFVLLSLIYALGSSSPVALPATGSNVTSSGALSDPSTCRAYRFCVTMIILDDELFGQNKKGRWEHDWLSVSVSPDLPYSKGFPGIFQKSGGEIRASFTFYFEYDYTSNAMAFVYDLRLYEGESEDTEDLDGQKSGRILVPAPPSVFLFDRTVNSEESGSDDYVRVFVEFDSVENPICR